MYVPIIGGVCYNKQTKFDAWEELAKAVGFWSKLVDSLFHNFETVFHAGVRIARSQKNSSSVTASLPSTGAAALYVVSFSKISDPLN
jgi:hypothetical protein